MLLRVLIVEDDPRLLSSFRRAYRGAYDLHTTGSARAALEVARAVPSFAVVVAGIGQPGLAGLRFLKAYQDIDPETSRILLIGPDDLAPAAEALRRGRIFRFIAKPCPEAAIAAAIDAGAAQFHRIANIIGPEDGHGRSSAWRGGA